LISSTIAFPKSIRVTSSPLLMAAASAYLAKFCWRRLVKFEQMASLDH
jgi:hypothetical protein